MSWNRTESAVSFSKIKVIIFCANRVSILREKMHRINFNAAFRTVQINIPQHCSSKWRNDALTIIEAGLLLHRTYNSVDRWSPLRHLQSQGDRLIARARDSLFNNPSKRMFLLFSSSRWPKWLLQICVQIQAIVSQSISRARDTLIRPNSFFSVLFRWKSGCTVKRTAILRQDSDMGERAWKNA